jgi:hypothetical protein
MAGIAGEKGNFTAICRQKNPGGSTAGRGAVRRYSFHVHFSEKKPDSQYQLRFAGHTAELRGFSKIP